MDENLNELPDRIGEALERLDQDAARRAKSVDSQRVADAVLKRLRDEPQVTVLHPRRRMAVGLRMAAALAVLVIGGVLGRQFVRGPALVTSIPVSVPDSVLADSTQRAAVMRAIDEARTAPDSMHATMVLVEDLNETELQTLLATMESAL